MAAATKDSSSAMIFVVTDRRYPRPPQYDCYRGYDDGVVSNTPLTAPCSQLTVHCSLLLPDCFLNSEPLSLEYDMNINAQKSMVIKNYIPQIKICGLTKVDEAVKCVGLGANAIGLIFYKKSPRFVSDTQARNICNALPDSVRKIGVFVDEPFDVIMEKVHTCGLTGIQLHGRETPQLIDRLICENLLVIKGLFTQKSPNISDVSQYKASAYLVECGKGKLPGGNAMTWNWSQAYDFGKKYPFILAGGLDHTNVVQAINQCFPDAVDVSSGVEISPGQKDIGKVKDFISAIHSVSGKNILNYIF